MAEVCAMDSEAIKILWIGTGVAAGIAVVITLIAAADNIPNPHHS
jgi:hypothetical protein